MKRFTIILAVIVMSAVSTSAQHYVGVRGGWGSADVRFYPSWKTPVYWGTYSGGVSWKYYSAERYLGGIEVDLEYLQRGFQYPTFSDENITYRRTINSVMMPFIWQPHFYMFDDRMRVFLNLGVTLSYNISSKEHQINKLTNQTTTSDYEMMLVRDNRWGYGLCGGFGMSYAVGRVELFAEGRYYFGYSDILKRATVYEPNGFQRSPLDNLSVSAGFYYRLGRNGEAGSKRESRRMKRSAEAELDAAQSEITGQNQ